MPIRIGHAFAFVTLALLTGCEARKPLAAPTEAPQAPAAEEETFSRMPPPPTPTATAAPPEPAVKRGTSARDYEGLYSADGSYRFRECSPFETGVAVRVLDLLREHPDRDEDSITKQVAREYRMKGNVVLGIYTKALSSCGVQ